MKFKTSTKLALGTASAALLVAGCAGGMSQGSGMTSAELDAVTQQVVKDSFHDKGIVKVSQVFAEDPTMKACNAADVAGQPLAPARAKEIEALNMKTIHWPANGKYLGGSLEAARILSGTQRQQPQCGPCVLADTRARLRAGRVVRGHLSAGAVSLQ